MSGRRQDQPRHARAEIRAFSAWLRELGWVYEGRDSNGHTEWSHPKASRRYRLPETPRHFDVQRARRDVQRLMGVKVPGKRAGKPKRDSAPRRDFALEQAVKQARERPRPQPRTTTDERPAPTGPAVPVRRVPRRLPWEDQPDDYDRGIDRLMRSTPGRWS